MANDIRFVYLPNPLLCPGFPFSPTCHIIPGILRLDGSTLMPDGSVVRPDGSVVLPDGTVKEAGFLLPSYSLPSMEARGTGAPVSYESSPLKCSWPTIVANKISPLIAINGN